ncbi:MAG: FlgD immunoglobulin-like domain containing protein [candidate division WOR-3 bacterium]
MISILIIPILLFSQPAYFDFLEYPQMGSRVGDSFYIYVVARKANGEIDTSYNGRALLKTSLDGLWPWSYIYPPLLNFYRGEIRTKAVVTIADESLSILVEDGLIRGQTPRIIFSPNNPQKLLLICPGETLLSGSPLGKHYTPQPQTAGIPFFVKVYLVDKHFNILKTRFDTISLSSSDSFASYPSFLPLINGKATFSFLPRAMGSRFITVSDLSDDSILSDTSSSFLVRANFYSRLLLLLPGEDFQFGDTNTSAWLTPGKRGKPFPQFVSDSFLVRVFCCDSFYNLTTGEDTVYLCSDFSFSYNPAPIPIQNSGSAEVVFHSAGENQNLWAVSKRGFETYRSFLNIIPKAVYLFVNHADTILAGWPTEISVLVLDGGSEPIPYKRVEFKVLKGNGEMLDSVIVTDSLGRGKARFIMPIPNLRDSISERDSILIRADTVDTVIGIWAEVFDNEVMRGEIIAIPNPFGSLNQDFTKIIYHLRDNVDIKVLIYDPFGNPIYKRLIKKGEMGARRGVNVTTWDGRDDKGNKVASGIYYVRVIGIAHTGRIFDKGYRIGVVW